MRSLQKMAFVAAAAGAGAAALAQSSDASRAYAAEALADASGRTSALAQPASTVNLFGYGQFRYNFNMRDDVPGGNDSTIGFQAARTKIGAKGNVNEDIGYYVLGFFDHADGSFGLHDAYGTWNLGDGWGLKWGQYKLPLMREESIGDTMQLTADRSVMNSVFSQTRSQGIEVNHTGDQFRFMADFSDGLRSLNTDFTAGTGMIGGGLEADYALTGRAEWLWGGAWERFNDFTSWQGAEFAGMSGAAIHYQGGGDTVGTFDVSVLQVTVDTSIEGDGWNAFIAGVYRNTDPTMSSDFDDFGWLLQGGVFLAADWEAFARVGQVLPDKDWTSGKTFTEITFGVNHYVIPESHAAKFTLDFTIFPTDQAGSSAIVTPSTLTGLLADAEDGQWNLRAQFQFMF